MKRKNNNKHNDKHSSTVEETTLLLNSRLPKKDSFLFFFFSCTFLISLFLFFPLCCHLSSTLLLFLSFSSFLPLRLRFSSPLMCIYLSAFFLSFWFLLFPPSLPLFSFSLSLSLLPRSRFDLSAVYSLLLSPPPLTIALASEQIAHALRTRYMQPDKANSMHTQKIATKFNQWKLQSKKLNRVCRMRQMNMHECADTCYFSLIHLISRSIMFLSCSACLLPVLLFAAFSRLFRSL